jgi:release factor glutamine methyltransferase
MVPEVMPSRRALLAEATAQLDAAGVSEPRREALRLWAELRSSAAEAMVEGEVEAEPELATALREAVRRRARGEPLAHVAGRAGFRTFTLHTDHRALIPRPETEGLVDLLLGRVRTGRVADIGTGIGCLALSLAAEGRFDLVAAVESSAEALRLANENRNALRLPVALVRGDLGGPLGPQSMDAVISNPPYLTEREYAELDPSVKAWEPAEALVSGPDGLRTTTRLLRETGDVLRPGGWLAVEVDCSRAGEVAARAESLGWMDVAIHADLFGRERYLLARRSVEP